MENTLPSRAHGRSGSSASKRWGLGTVRMNCCLLYTSEAHHMEKGRRLLQDYDAVMDKVAEAEELSADHRPSTLERLAELASDTSCLLYTSRCV